MTPIDFGEHREEREALALAGRRGRGARPHERPMAVLKKAAKAPARRKQNAFDSHNGIYVFAIAALFAGLGALPADEDLATGLAPDGAVDDFGRRRQRLRRLIGGNGLCGVWEGSAGRCIYMWPTGAYVNEYRSTPPTHARLSIANPANLSAGSNPNTLA